MRERETSAVLPGDCVHCPVRALTVYGGVHAEEAETIQKMRHGVRTVPARRDIYREGDRVEEFATLYDGWAFRYTVLPEGSRQILAFILPGENLGWATLSGSRIGYSVQALTDTSLCILDRDKVSQYLADNPRVARRFQSLVTSCETRCDRRIAELGRRNAVERVAGLLHDIQVRLCERGRNCEREFPFPLRQQHIADAVGLTQIHVSRVLGDLEAKRVVQRTGRRITVLDQTTLNRLASTTSRTGNSQPAL